MISTFWIKMAIVAAVLALTFGAGAKTAINFYKVRELKAQIAGKDAEIQDLRRAAATSVLLNDFKDKIETAAAATIDAIKEATDAAETEDRAIPVVDRLCRDLSDQQLDRLRKRILAEPSAGGPARNPRSKPRH